MTALMICGLLLIFIILLQRGRGGGLAGALGGAGGQSAFGTKAGDIFTRITVGLALVWFLFAVFSLYAMQNGGTKFQGGTAAVPTAPELTDVPDTSAPATGLPTEPAATTEPAMDAPAEPDAKADSATPPAAAESKPASGEEAAPAEAAAKTPDAAETPEKPETPAAPAETKSPE
ncbi:preprotein translocase subunit SecG [bacterium]|nr:preprotein translocase subunit SecG [bacterium]